MRAAAKTKESGAYVIRAERKRLVAVERPQHDLIGMRSKSRG
jgi:hypothetical protein